MIYRAVLYNVICLKCRDGAVIDNMAELAIPEADNMARAEACVSPLRVPICVSPYVNSVRAFLFRDGVGPVYFLRPRCRQRENRNRRQPIRLL